MNPIDDLIAAIRDEGPQPYFHHQTMARHRREWPTLWRAIDQIIEDSRSEAAGGPQDG